MAELGVDNSPGGNGNALAFSANDTLYFSDEQPDAPFASLMILAQDGSGILLTMALNFPAGLVHPRFNAMDFSPVTEVLYGSLVSDFRVDRQNFLATIDETTGDVTILGPTANQLSAIAWVPEPSQDTLLLGALGVLAALAVGRRRAL